MKLAILCNFGPFPQGSVGGSEAVIAAISERLLCSPYNYEIDIYAHNYKKPSIYNGINLFPCPKGNGIISRIAQNEHIMFYSDSQWNFDSLLGVIGKVSQKVSICLVGAYHLQSYPESFKLLKENIDKFNLITHSFITPDHQFCIDNNLPVNVIPNGVNLSEFRENSINFREKYKIKEKYIILSVFSYFYGKGFELLSKIARKLSENLDDFIILQLSNTAQYPYDLVFLDRTKKQCKGLPVRFIRDAPREDIVAAFKVSDVFLQTSKKEVAPIVILESRAAKLPYVSMRVGSVEESRGGIIINNPNIDKKGYKIVDDKIINSYVSNIVEILESKDLRKNLINEGQKNIESIDWNNIVPLYDKVFRK